MCVTHLNHLDSVFHWRYKIKTLPSSFTDLHLHSHKPPKVENHLGLKKKKIFRATVVNAWARQRLRCYIVLWNKIVDLCGSCCPALVRALKYTLLSLSIEMIQQSHSEFLLQVFQHLYRQQLHQKSINNWKKKKKDLPSRRIDYSYNKISMLIMLSNPVCVW